MKHYAQNTSGLACTVSYVRSCDKCQRTKLDHNHAPVPLCPLPITETFGRLHIDFVGPLVKTTQGHEHLLVVVDSFSR